jgi:hypothetical protein
MSSSGGRDRAARLFLTGGTRAPHGNRERAAARVAVPNRPWRNPPNTAKEEKASWKMLIFIFT